MKILLSGSSGLIGSALKERLESEHHEVVALPRTYEDAIDFTGVTALVHLAGESIATGRWTDDKKKRIEESRVKGTKQLADQLAKSRIQPDVFICASAIGYYGDRGDEILEESSHAGNDFLAEVCQRWEAATAPATTAGVRTVNMRTGIVLSTDGGALKKMLTPFKLGGGGIVGNGKQYMSWIDLDDMVSIIVHMIENKSVSGPVNVVAPNCVTNKEFTKVLGKVLHRPTVLPLPAFAAKAIFGEMADALLLSSARVMPTKLVENGYTFKFPTLELALEHILR